MLKISCAGCLGLSQAISAQITLEICVAAQHREKIIKTPILSVQCCSRSLILMSIERAYGTFY